MPKRSKVFLPKWMRWFAIPLLAVIWGVLTYHAFGSPQGRAEIGLGEWLGVTAILGLVAAGVWLMSSGKLPAYIIETEEDSEDK